MDAYELADDLDNWEDCWLSTKQEKDVFKEHAQMLRNQADQIEGYKSLVFSLEKEIERFERKTLKLLDLMLIREGQPNK